MFYMPGLTVEALTAKDAFRSDMPKDKVTVTNKELRETQEELQTTCGKIDFVKLGCPHYTLNQIAEVATLLENKKLHKDVTFWVCTSATAKILADRIGYTKTIEKAGGQLVVDTCIDEPCWIAYKQKIGMTDSPKCAYYRRYKDVMVGRLKDCVDAAVRGEWK